jgi:predicted nucleic acid-binding protein
MISAMAGANWRIYSTPHLLDEIERVLERLGFSRRFAVLTSERVRRRSRMVEAGTSHHRVAEDEADTPILRAAMAASVDFLVTNDRHILALDPCEGVRIISMAQYFDLLVNEGLIQPKA